MNRFPSLVPLLAGLLLALAIALPHAVAQPPLGDEGMSTVSTSISSTAAVVPAVSGKRIVVRSCVLASSGAGVVVFQDGSGGSTLANIYLAANTNLVLDEQFFGAGGITTTRGNGLYAVLSGATLTATLRVLRD